MKDVMDFAARRLSVAACAYYHFNTPITDDANYDALSRLVADNYEYLPQYYQEVFESAEAIRTTGHHIYVSRQCFQATLRAMRDAGVEEDLQAPDFEPTAVWEDAEGNGVEIMGLGG